jgi:hypothetical protein
MTSETTRLHSEPPDLTLMFSQVIASSKGSFAGFHANSEWLTCPERARLRAAGIRRKPFEARGGFVGEDFELDALDYGTLIHELLRIKTWFPSGHEMAVNVLDGWKSEIGHVSHLKASLQLGAHEQEFPQAADPLRYFGVECEVITNIRMGETDPRPCLRSVRYDAAVGAVNGTGEIEVYSLERKTAARSGGLNAYRAQASIQVALWNSNAELVRQYGKMKGVIIESHIKTKTPSCERNFILVSPHQEFMARSYLRYSENGSVVFAQAPDGTYPKMLHACWGRFTPCDYVNLCHEGITGDYTQNVQEI